MTRKKDIQFYENVIIPLYDQVFAYILSSVSDKYIAQDLTQETFENAYKYIHQLREREKAKSWVLAIAANKVRAWYIEKQKQEWLFGEEDRLWINGDMPSDVIEDISLILEQKEQRLRLRKAFWHLDPLIREVLSLNLLLEVPLKIIAEEMGVNYITLRSWKRRSLKRLRTELEKLERGDEDER